jgi:hypothetical protein
MKDITLSDEDLKKIEKLMQKYIAEAIEKEIAKFKPTYIPCPIYPQPTYPMQPFYTTGDPLPRETYIVTCESNGDKLADKIVSSLNSEFRKTGVDRKCLNLKI